jgi:hypothetical protein
MTSSGRRFLGLARYLLHGRSGEETERVAWTAGRHLGTDDPELAAALMQATADQNVRVEAPVYHLTISFDPSDTVTRERMEGVADRVLADLGLSEHQALLVAHQDRAHPHVHLMVNRVHPETGLAWERWQDRPRIERTLRELEQALGLRAVAGRLYQLEGQELPERALLTTGEYQQALRTGEPAFPDRVRAHLPELRAAESWAELEERLHAHGLRLERKGQGLIITDGEHQVKASRVARDLSLHRLEERFGVPFPGREAELARRATLSPDLAQLKPALEEYERVAALPEDVYRTEGEISSLTHRERNLDLTLGRLQATSKRFDHDLAEVYRDPAAARKRFLAAVAELGAQPAADRMREQPECFGALRTTERSRALGLWMTPDDTAARASALRTGTAGQEFAGAHDAAVAAVRERGLETSHTPVATALERALALTTEQLAEAKARLGPLRQAVRDAPSRALLEHSIARVMARLEPREIKQLRLLVTAPQALLALQARGVLIDLALGRAEEREA